MLQLKIKCQGIIQLNEILWGEHGLEITKRKLTSTELTTCCHSASPRPQLKIRKLDKETPS